MLLLRDYNNEKKLDRAWFNSSTVVYSECDDVSDGLKVLRVTFKNGSTYEYKDVDVNNYLMFLRGGLDGSHGKALNEFIKKKKCPYERIADKNISEINEEMEKIKQQRLLEQEKKETN